MLEFLSCPYHKSGISASMKLANRLIHILLGGGGYPAGPKPISLSVFLKETCFTPLVLVSRYTMELAVVLTWRKNSDFDQPEPITIP